MKKGRLFLIPVPLGEVPVETALPQPVLDRVKQLDYLIAENAKTARAFLKKLPLDKKLQQINIHELDEHTPESELPRLLYPLTQGFDVGLVSEAGCPAVADPGARMVACAHAAGIRVIPMIGPSSILLALMGSGLSGQNFSFHGYLPVKEEQRKKHIQTLEIASKREQRTQIFIETPYRNLQMLETLLNTCIAKTRICLATDLTLENESIITRTTHEWQQEERPEINRRPTVFLLQA